MHALKDILNIAQDIVDNQYDVCRGRLRLLYVHAVKNPDTAPEFPIVVYIGLSDMRFFNPMQWIYTVSDAQLVDMVIYKQTRPILIDLIEKSISNYLQRVNANERTGTTIRHYFY